MKYYVTLALVLAACCGIVHGISFTDEQTETYKPTDLEVDPARPDSIHHDTSTFEFNAIAYSNGTPVQVEWDGRLVDSVPIVITFAELKIALAQVGVTNAVWVFNKFQEAKEWGARYKIQNQ